MIACVDCLYSRTMLSDKQTYHSFISPYLELSKECTVVI